MFSTMLRDKVDGVGGEELGGLWDKVGLTQMISTTRELVMASPDPDKGGHRGAPASSGAASSDKGGLAASATGSGKNNEVSSTPSAPVRQCDGSVSTTGPKPGAVSKSGTVSTGPYKMLCHSEAFLTGMSPEMAVPFWTQYDPQLRKQFDTAVLYNTSVLRDFIAERECEEVVDGVECGKGERGERLGEKNGGSQRRKRGEGEKKRERGEGEKTPIIDPVHTVDDGTTDTNDGTIIIDRIFTFTPVCWPLWFSKLMLIGGHVIGRVIVRRLVESETRVCHPPRGAPRKTPARHSAYVITNRTCFRKLDELDSWWGIVLRPVYRSIGNSASGEPAELAELLGTRVSSVEGLATRPVPHWFLRMGAWYGGRALVECFVALKALQEKAEKAEKDEERSEKGEDPESHGLI